MLTETSKTEMLKKKNGKNLTKYTWRGTIVKDATSEH